MEISSFLIMLVAYFGIVAGFFLGKIAPEERKPLKNTVRILGHIAGLVALGAALIGAYFNKNSILMAVFVALAALVIYAHTASIKTINRHQLWIASIVFGIFLVCTTGNTKLFVSSGTFVFFTSVSILETNSNIPSLGRVAIQTCWFFTPLLLTLL
jgi:hypothetical protein